MWQIEKHIKMDRNEETETSLDDIFECWKKYETSWKSAVDFVEEIDSHIHWEHKSLISYGLSKKGNMYRIKKVEKS